MCVETDRQPLGVKRRRPADDARPHVGFNATKADSAHQSNNPAYSGYANKPYGLQSGKASTYGNSFPKKQSSFAGQPPHMNQSYGAQPGGKQTNGFALGYAKKPPPTMGGYSAPLSNKQFSYAGPPTSTAGAYPGGKQPKYIPPSKTPNYIPPNKKSGYSIPPNKQPNYMPTSKQSSYSIAPGKTISRLANGSRPCSVQMQPKCTFCSATQVFLVSYK